MKQICFCHNWNNKLFQPVFTTIRNYRPSKCHYYLDSIGETFEIILDGKKFSKAVLLKVSALRYCVIQPELIMLDTGIIEPSEALKLFKKFKMQSQDSMMIVLTFAQKEK